MNKTYLYIIIGVLVVIALVIIYFSIISFKKKNRLNQLDQLQDRISTLKALPVQYLLNKVSLMPKSLEVEEQYQEWSAIYSRLSNEESFKIKQKVLEIESLVYARKIKLADELLKDLEKSITLYEQEYEKVLSDLSNATQVDVKNREEITNQKELFRNYKKMYQSNYNSYKPYNNAIEKYFVNIEDAFTNIDVLLNQSQVDKARTKGASLEGELLKMKDILNNLPSVLEELTKDLPDKFKLVEERYNSIIVKKYNLRDLDIPTRFKNINKDILRVLSKNNDVFLKDLQDTSHFAHEELDRIIEQLDNEVRANEKLDQTIEILVQSSIKADANCKKANEEIVSIKNQYLLTKNEEANLIMETRLLKDLLTIKNEIVSKHLKSNYFASALQLEAANLLEKIDVINMALTAYIERMVLIRSDEKRLVEEYNNMLYIIKDCEAKLREMDLPMLSQAYYDTINESKIGLNKLVDLMNDEPLNIALIHLESNKVSDVVYKLYDNARNLLKTAQMAENTIIFGNRYRSLKPEIDSMLTRAELFFNNGEYTKSLSSAIEAIETIYPSIRKELLTYKSDQLKATPMSI